MLRLFASIVGHTTKFFWKESLKWLMSNEQNMLNINCNPVCSSKLFGIENYLIVTIIVNYLINVVVNVVSI